MTKKTAPVPNFLLHIARIIVGGLFIFSGFVKLIDPKGSQYKFEEYFSAGVLNMEVLIPYALYFSVFLIVVEIYFGFAVLLGYKAKSIMKFVLLMIIFFTFLTFYSAYFNKVTDCGCFGDAIKLTPWQSFYKDIILLVLIIFLYKYKEYIYPYFSRGTVSVITNLSAILSLIFAIYTIRHLPVQDFRAYKIGTNIPEGMEYKGDGKIPPIHDFFLENERQDLTQDILKMDKVMLVIAYDLNKAELQGFENIKKLADKARANGYEVYAVSASFTDIIELTKNKYNLDFPFLFCDETTLKTMIRANPGIMILKEGTITEKKSWRDTEDIDL